MRVLVLGGTGAMGTHLVDLLIQSGVEVAVTSRSRSGTEGIFQYIHGNAQNDTFLRSVLRERLNPINITGQ